LVLRIAKVVYLLGLRVPFVAVVLGGLYKALDSFETISRPSESQEPKNKIEQFKNEKILMIAAFYPIALIIPVLAILLGMSIPLLAICLDFMKRKKFMELQHQQRMAAIEKGIDLPPMSIDMIDEKHGHKRNPNYLLRGLIWLFTGIAVTVALYFNEHFREAFFGLIPTGIGLAFLIYYFVEGRKIAQERRVSDAKEPATVSS
jgi:hypothetical protein